MCVCSYSEEPEDKVLLFTDHWTISVTRDSIAKQPESKRTSKYVNVFLDRKMYVYNTHEANMLIKFLGRVLEKQCINTAAFTIT